MKVKVTDKKIGGVWGQAVVTMTGLTKEDTDTLRAALATVDKYRKKAESASGLSPKHADWAMVDFAVKTDAVVCTVQAGACG